MTRRRISSWAGHGRHAQRPVRGSRPFWAAVAAAVAVGSGWVPLATAAGQTTDVAQPLLEVRSSSAGELELGTVSGVAHATDTGELLVAGLGEVGRRPEAVGISTLGDVSSRGRLASDPAGGDLAYDPRADRLVDVSGDRLVAADTGRTQRDLARLGVERVGGIEYGPDGSLLVLDSLDPSIVQVPRGAGPGQVTRTPLSPAPEAPEALAYNAADGQLYAADAATDQVLAYGLDGRKTATYDLTSAGVYDVTSMEFAPTPDTTDDPALTSLFVTDTAGAGGRLVELALAPTAAALVAPTSTTATLVRATNAWQYSPPSPDTAGVTFSSRTNQLILSDSEVEEMSNLYVGANLFFTQLTGPLVRTGDTTHYSIEPTGIAFKRGSGAATTDRLLVSDDDRNKIFEVTPPASGPSAGVFGSTGDTATQFDTGVAGNGDAEDVAHDPTTGDVYVIDGVNKEVYVYNGGTFRRQFDVGAFGAQDPEGIAYHPDRGTLLVVDQGSRKIYEVTTDGQLLTNIDIAAASTKKAAGITVAPASNGSSAKNVYVVARGVDNNTNPAENDGMLYEFSVNLTPLGNMPPAVSAGPDKSVDQTAPAQLDGSASDDGQPGALTTAWSMVSGPAGATVTFAQPASPTTTATFSAVGSYVLRLTASDGEFTVSDDVTIEALGTGSTLALDTAVVTGSDDAEEKPSGSVSLSGADLELVTDQTTVQTVGVRFAGVGVPAGATIVDAYLQFTVDEVSTDAASLTVRGEAADNPGTFLATSRNVSSRARTTASVPWTPPVWNTVGASGLDQRTPSLAAVVQEIVGRAGWAEGNAMAFIVTGSGRRTAEAFDGTAAPKLHVDYRLGSGGPGPDPGPTNQPPTVSAGPDKSTTVGTAVTLDGSVNDDGLPTGSTATAAWTQDSGPAGGTAGFADAAAATTDATFDVAGSYVLKLTGSDGVLSASDTVTVTVTETDPGPGPGPTPVSLSLPVTAGSDDAEEKPSGSTGFGSSDLELVTDGSTVQTVGVRFTNVTVPPGALITKAYVQFTTDQASSGATSLTIKGHAADNAPTFTTTKFDISSRPRTVASASWAPVPWTVVGAAGPDQQTPELKSVVQEVVNRAGWASGNAVALVITGTGSRVAEAFNGSAAPVLKLEYQPSGGTTTNTAPQVVAGSNQLVVLGAGTTLEGTVTDDGLPGTAPLESTWSVVSGPGPVDIADPSAPTTDASFTVTGTHVLELHATDGVLENTDRIAIDVVGAGSAQSLAVPVAQGSDDAEERLSNGKVGLASGDLELGFDKSREQAVGMRFAGLTIPRGATITHAYVQFTVDQVDSVAASFVIRAQAADDAATFQSRTNDVTGRPLTTASATWTPAAWTVVKDSGADQRTSDLAAVLQAVVDRPGWASGNAVVLVVTTTGTGARTADSFEGRNPPVLHIDYQLS